MIINPWSHMLQWIFQCFCMFIWFQTFESYIPKMAQSSCLAPSMVFLRIMWPTYVEPSDDIFQVTGCYNPMIQSHQWCYSITINDHIWNILPNAVTNFMLNNLLWKTILYEKHSLLISWLVYINVVTV